MKFIIPFMVIAVREIISSVSPAHQKAQDAEKPSFTKVQLFYPAGAKHFITTLSTLGYPVGHFRTEGKHCTPSFSH